jgi:hypothetical protein
MRRKRWYPHQQAKPFPEIWRFSLPCHWSEWGHVTSNSTFKGDWDTWFYSWVSCYHEQNSGCVSRLSMSRQRLHLPYPLLISEPLISLLTSLMQRDARRCSGKKTDLWDKNGTNLCHLLISMLQILLPWPKWRSMEQEIDTYTETHLSIELLPHRYEDIKSLHSINCDEFIYYLAFSVT